MTTFSPNTAGMTVFARIQEGVVAELRSVNPALGHHRKGPGTPGWAGTLALRSHNQATQRPLARSFAEAMKRFGMIE